MKFLLNIGLIVLFLYCIAMLLLYIFQRDLLYFPTEKYHHPFEEIQLKNQNETISVIVLNKGKDKALIYFGGNGDAVVSNAEEFKSAFPNFTIYLLNYRGYGGSSGKPSEQAIYSDALALYEAIKPKHPKISVLGRSLGSGVATYVAANRDIDKTVLITPYDSILNVAQKRFKLFPVSFLLKDIYDSTSRVSRISSKVLVIAAENDQIIPMANTEKLVNEFPRDQLHFEIIKNSGHNDLSNSITYYPTIQAFLTMD